MHAFCYASGHIGFGPEVPPEALPLAEGPKKPLMDFISGVARHSRTSDDLFVPGLPSAKGIKTLPLTRCWRLPSGPPRAHRKASPPSTANTVRVERNCARF